MIFTSFFTGKPPPKIVWYLNDTLVDRKYEMTAQSGWKSKQETATIVQNQLSIDSLGREFFNSLLTCQALTNANGNVQPFTAPASTSIRIEMHCKPSSHIFLSPIASSSPLSLLVHEIG